MAQAADSTDDHRAGIVWLLADMVLITAMTAIVKAQGATYPAIQLVFIRALIGLVAILPLVWRHRLDIRSTRRAGRHVVRVSCNALALTANFAALAALPLALVNAIGFMRPLVAMLFAVLLLKETIGRMRWLGAIIGFLGVLIMVAPGEVRWDLGLAAAFASIIFGSLATVQTRMLRDENTTVLMVFYTVGLALITAIPAAFLWQPLASGDWTQLLVIGCLAQAGQYCFLRAYQSTPANILAPIGYLSIVLATATGYFVFGEVPGWNTIIGVGVILAALRMIAVFDRRAAGRRTKGEL